MRFSESLENLIEIVYLLNNGDKFIGVRVTDIAESLNIKKSSVHELVKKLKTENILIHEKYGNVFLTDLGCQLATEIYNKHLILLEFLTEVVGVSKENAIKEACQLEHILSSETITKLKILLNKHKSKQLIAK